MKFGDTDAVNRITDLSLCPLFSIVYSPFSCRQWSLLYPILPTSKPEVETAIAVCRSDEHDLPAVYIIWSVIASLT
jgi:hypothetical protein